MVKHLTWTEAPTPLLLFVTRSCLIPPQLYVRPNKAPADETGQMSLGPVSTVRGSGRCSQGKEGEQATQILPKSRASHPLSHVILPTNTSYLTLKRCVSYLKKGQVGFLPPQHSSTVWTLPIKTWPV